MKTILMASDHAGFVLKAILKKYLEKSGLKVKDLGTDTADSCDYPDYAAALSRLISGGKYQRGVLICKSGIGNSIIANRFPGVRAALCSNLAAAQLSRQHNDSNVLVLGSGFVNAAAAKKILKAWIKTGFEGGRHARRLNKIKGIEKELRGRK